MKFIILLALLVSMLLGTLFLKYPQFAKEQSVFDPQETVKKLPSTVIEIPAPSTNIFVGNGSSSSNVPMYDSTGISSSVTSGVVMGYPSHCTRTINGIQVLVPCNK